ncbi:ABC transporter permease [Catenovulum sp. SM1970]|uniref:ABC transporter permease n=1 Tax=Marinifaba aquimaris TaxID=2741323 RepID=UPI00157305E9|nr:ABC transporter permease [Marinifaba aquimaris]NTS78007.1 ABC transporter permease [Marinifaba aquimaris]
MQQFIDISWWQLGLFSLTLFIPFAINYRYQLSIGKDAILAISRMVIQLGLIGLYLAFLFELNNLWVNLVWLILMIGIGASAIISKAKLPKKHLFIPVSLGLVVGLFPLLMLLTLAVIQPTPFYHAQYLIPLAGMLLGNSLSANIVSLQHFFLSFEDKWPEYEAALALGASPKQACFGFVQNALRKALAPILATMATTGLVSLPGMMTGQILGGTSPMIAIKYQVLIMIAIWVMMSISITLCLWLVVKQSITRAGKPLIRAESER